MTRQPVVAELMTPDPAVLRPEEGVPVAARKMERFAIRHLPVVDRDGLLCGILSHRDVVACRDDGLRIRDLMSEDVKTVRPETAAHEAAYLLLRHKIGCLPVVSDEGRLVGIITETDFVRAAVRLLGGAVDPDQLRLEEEEAERA
jgi:CBS domain-containing membrane protein